MFPSILKLFFLSIILLPVLSKAEKNTEQDKMNIYITHILGEQKNSNYHDKWIAEDKGKHFIGSFISTVFISKLLSYSIDQSKDKIQYSSVSFVLTIGLAKEYNDSQKVNNYFSWKDLSANLFGIVLGIIVLNIE